jgi:hypothetical protein
MIFNAHKKLLANPVVVFGLRAIAWFLVGVAAWWLASPWLSFPVAGISGWMLEYFVPMWIQGASYADEVLQVNSYIGIFDPQTQQLGDIVVEVLPARYSYGLPMVLALLAASGTLWHGRRGWRSALMAYLVLLPTQAFSICVYVLMQIVLAVQMQLNSLGISQWQMELLIFSYQIGTLLLPTLVPVIVWLWLDRVFFQRVIVLPTRTLQ